MAPSSRLSAKTLGAILVLCALSLAGIASAQPRGAFAGSYSGSLSDNDTYYVNIDIDFRADGTLTATIPNFYVDGVDDGEYYYFYIGYFTHTGTYDYDPSNDKLEMNVDWTGSRAASDDPNFTLTRARLWTRDGRLDVTSDGTTISGTVRSRIEGHYSGEGDGSEEDNLTLILYGSGFATPTPTPLPPNSCTVLSDSLPDTVNPGQAVNSTIQLQNTGSRTWSNASPHRLSVRTDTCGLIPQGYIPLSSDVPPGGTATFDVTFIAPSSPGTCTLELQMVEETVEFFGPTVSQTITVGGATGCDTPVDGSNYQVMFSGSDECWQGVGLPGIFDVPAFNTIGDGLRISANGSNNCFGFWKSPPVTVQGGQLYVVTWILRSDVAQDQVPELRLRVSEAENRHAALEVISSAGGGQMSPGIGFTQYFQTYLTAAFETQVFLNLDILSFDPANNANASIDIVSVSMEIIE